MVITITLNPAVDNALFLPKLQIGDTNRVVRVDKDAGGKGINQSRVIAGLGGTTLATGFLGGPEGAFIRQVLDDTEVRHDFIETAEPTRVNFSVEDETKSPPTTFNLPGPIISTQNWIDLINLCERHLPEAAWVSMAGSLPRGVPHDAYRTLGNLFESRGVKMMLDADDEPMRLGLESRPHFIKPNEKEAARYLCRPVSTDEEAIAAAREMLRLCAEGGFVVLSRGGKGAVLASAEGTWLGRSPEVEVRSTMGSGDSMIAATLWAIEDGMKLEKAFAWGLAAGAATAATDGTKIAGQAGIVSLVPHATIIRI